ncbi:binding-protein-dependent transport systems inner membrane component [Thermoanaerobacterium thermosaccharolyticum DSM 571]|uniref:Binding-protein-dependent transport systems inner membrane component n=1 Tax=Thermoanaerobacterium thermosaccharolyticum (strain ATCC 7956 / DSM 571 / NCIMB 9385 / NCA 3814 / NCTC 13789 / WDCM 00135 / 2032) TaxID=580327 RepID=D9TMQ3_THETC|nr:sugar ABC transporter permease [Thermoanaerobacterium thermosaccharolyticum]ADL70105.1 binding-protein-dependent transport systems inner membrane component [Thermoanaerobacterium thermosaccharolyticum DSM 571]
MIEKKSVVQPKQSKFYLNDAILGYLLVAPALLCIIAIALYPVLNTFKLSLYYMKLQLIGMTHFIGFQNYISLFNDPRFRSASINTVIFTIVSVSLELVIGMIMALLMNKKFKGTGLVRAAILIPWAIPTIVSALMWKFIYNDQFGLLNDILLRMGIINSYKAWLGSPSLAMGSAIFADVWKTAPFMALLLLAGLQNISYEFYEAAKVDGAGSIRRFFSITLPLLKPTILVALIFRTLDAFRVFDLIFVMTGGGPGNSTETLTIYAYKTLFRNLDFGIGSAIAVVIFIFVFVFAMIYIRLLDKSILE